LVDGNGYFLKNRNHQQIKWMYNNINDELKQLFYGSKDIASELSTLEKDIISSEISPVKAAQQIIEKFKKTF
jgi:LAO/AO transport system kinase